MQDDSLKQARIAKNKTFTKQGEEPTLELLQSQIHFDWAGIQQPLCDRPYVYCQLFTHNEVDVTCPDCWYLLLTKHTRPDGSVSYYRPFRRTWERDELMDEDF
jgi:hypothetical protein